MSTIELVLQMQTLMQYRSPKGLWHARATGCSEFACGATPRIAMEAALALREQQQAPTQQSLYDDDL